MGFGESKIIVALRRKAILLSPSCQVVGVELARRDRAPKEIRFSPVSRGARGVGHKRLDRGPIQTGLEFLSQDPDVRLLEDDVVFAGNRVNFDSASGQPFPKELRAVEITAAL